MKITLIQQEIHWGDKSHNLEVFSRMVHEHYGLTDVLVLPEMFSTGFCVDAPELAETVDGAALQAVHRWAVEGRFAVVGSVMATDGKQFYNRGFFCQPNGTIAFADKRHLFIGDEQKFFTAGNKVLNVTYKGVKFRVLICYDLRFPVWSRNVGGNSYDVLIYCANWPKDRIEAWDTLTVARAMENQSYVCAVNVVGTDNYNIHHNGHSTLIDPRGRRILTFADDEIGARTGLIDLDKLQRVRNRLPFWRDGDRFELK